MYEEPRKLTSEEKKDPLILENVVEGLRASDPLLAESVSKRFTRHTWRRMLAKAAMERPEVFGELHSGLKALKGGRAHTPSGEEVKGRLRRLSRYLVEEYACDQGFVPTAERTHAVFVYLKGNLVTGLPPEITKLSDKLAEEHKTFRKWTMGFDNRTFVADLTMEQVERLRANPAVAGVEIPPEANILSNEIPPYNPTGVNLDWGVQRILTATPWGEGNYGETGDGQKVKVCVCDTGIKKDHPAFWKDGVTVYKGGHNFVAGGDNPADDHDHGTYCCGIVAEQHTGLIGTYKGVAPEIELYACKVLDSKGSGSFANVAAGIDWARTNGMHIISLSLGGPSGTTGLQAACDAAWYAGLLVVAAAGNDGPDPNTVGYPGRYSSVIAVAATDFQNNVATFSSRGPEVEVAAPGRYISGPWAGFTYDEYVIANSNNLYMCASGTSAACPHVAAAGALIKAWYFAATNLQIRQWLRDYAMDL